MTIDNKIVVVFKCVCKGNITLVYTMNTDSMKKCVHYISEGHNDTNAIRYIFDSKESHKKILFCGYGNYDYDTEIINFIISMKLTNPSDIYSHMVFYNPEENKDTLFKFFYSIDLKRIWFAEKLRPNFLQAAYALNKTVTYSDDISELIKSNDIDVVNEILNICKDKIELRFKLFKEKKINALSVDDTLLGIRCLTKTYLDKTEETFSSFIQGRTQPTSFVVEQFIRPIKAKNKKIKEFIDKAMKMSINPENTGKNAWQEDLIIPNLKLSVGQGGVRSINSPEHFRGTIFKFDFTSMFPTVMCNYSLFPRHLSQDFRNLYKSIRDERIKAKNERNKDRASFLKNILNSSIGLMNSDWNYMYDPVMNTCIRIQSMFITLGLIDRLLELEDAVQIIQVNVDGVFVLAKKDTNSWLTLIALTMKTYAYELDMPYEIDYFNELWQYSVNDYVGTTYSGEVVEKGLFANDISKSITPQVVRIAILSNLIAGVPIKSYIDECKDGKMFLSSTNVGGGYCVLHGKETVPNSVRFVYANTKESYILVRQKDDKQSLVDKYGCIVIYDVDKININKIDKRPYYLAANKIVMAFNQLKLF